MKRTPARPATAAAKGAAPTNTTSEVPITATQAAHYAGLEAAVTRARQEADRLERAASQPLLATAESLLLGAGVTSLAGINVVGIGGTPERPTLRYEAKAP